METTTIKEPWLTFLGGLSVIIISRVTPRGTGRSSAVFLKKLFPAGEDLVWQTHKSGHKIRRRSLQSFACNVPLRWFAFDRVKIQPAPRGLPADYAVPLFIEEFSQFQPCHSQKILPNYIYGSPTSPDGPVSSSSDSRSVLLFFYKTILFPFPGTETGVFHGPWFVVFAVKVVLPIEIETGSVQS